MELFLKRSVLWSYYSHRYRYWGFSSVTVCRSMSWLWSLPCTNTRKSVVNSDSPVQCFCNPVSSKETLKPFFNEQVYYIAPCLFIYTLKGQEKPQMGCFSRVRRGSCRVQDVALCCDFSMTDLREKVWHAFHFQFCFCIPYQ